MQVSHRFFNTTAECLAQPVQALHGQLLQALEDLAVPLYAGKSSKQPGLDLVHPVLNVMVEYWLKTLDWGAQGRINALTKNADESQKSVDFMFELEDGRFIAVEVQFGNAGRTDTDFNKFVRLHRLGKLALAYVVCMDHATAQTADSGLATFEKYVREAPQLDGAVPMCIVGLSREDSRTASLAEIPGVPFPQVFGGSPSELHAAVARAVVDQRDLSQLQLDDTLQAHVATHARAHLAKSLRACKQDIQRVVNLQEGRLRDELLDAVDEGELLELLQQVRQLRAARQESVAASAKPAERPACEVSEPVHVIPQDPSVQPAATPAAGTTSEAATSAPPVVKVQYCPPAGKLRPRNRKPAAAPLSAPAAGTLKPTPPGATARLVQRAPAALGTPQPRWSQRVPVAAAAHHGALGAAFTRALTR